MSDGQVQWSVARDEAALVARADSIYRVSMRRDLRVTRRVREVCVMQRALFLPQPVTDDVIIASYHARLSPELARG